MSFRPRDAFLVLLAVTTGASDAAALKRARALVRQRRIRGPRSGPWLEWNVARSIRRVALITPPDSSKLAVELLGEPVGLGVVVLQGTPELRQILAAPIQGAAR